VTDRLSPSQCWCAEMNDSRCKILVWITHVLDVVHHPAFKKYKQLTKLSEVDFSPYLSKMVGNQILLVPRFLQALGRLW